MQSGGHSVGPLKGDMTCQNLPIANANFQEFDFCWQLTEEKQLLFVFLYMYMVIFTLIFRVYSYGKQSYLRLTC